jgi:asparagine synthase (glutamine-hydrolysing)
LPALLRYEDRNSMAFSIESRVPFLTPELVNFVLSLPEEYLIHSDGTSKAIFRAAMQGIVPDCILSRRDKIGFQTPEHRWLSCLASWVQSVLNGTASDRIPALNLEQVKRDWQNMRQRPETYDSRAWRWVNLIRWTNHFDVSYD